MKRYRPLYLIPLLCVLTLFPLHGEAAGVHVLKKNETLYSIARQYDVSVEEIVKSNNINDPTDLPVGMRLTIPGGGSSYTVRRGDTLYGIARRYGLSVEELKRHNGLSTGYILKAGDVLMIPGRDDPNRVADPSEYPVGSTDPVDPVDPTDPTDPTGTSEDSLPPQMDDPEGFWPLDGYRRYVDGKLKGIQIQGVQGDPVRSISSGKVIWAGPYRGFGRVILVQSSDDYIYVYGGNEETGVEVGQEVEPGTIISTLGINPHLQEPVLFFTVFRNGEPVSPEKAPRL
jgi:murein DD-endopeptidase MepM/ murein hydrolase activator NlpD